MQSDRPAHGPTPHWCSTCSRTGIVKRTTKRAKRVVHRVCGGCGGRGFWLDFTTLRAAS